MKLKAGDKIKAIGYPLLSHINNGRVWTVLYNYKRYGIDYYVFRYGKSTIAHKVDTVHLWLNTDNDNRIETVN